MVKLVNPKKLQATDSCCCSLTGAAAVVGAMTGALVITSTLVNSRLGTIVGSADGDSVVDREGETDGVSVAVTIGGFTTGAMVLDVLVVVGGGGDEIGVDVVFGTLDIVGAPLLGDVAVDVPAPLLQFPVPQ